MESGATPRLLPARMGVVGTVHRAASLEAPPKAVLALAVLGLLGAAAWTWRVREARSARALAAGLAARDEEYCKAFFTVESERRWGALEGKLAADGLDGGDATGEWRYRYLKELERLTAKIEQLEGALRGSEEGLAIEREKSRRAESVIREHEETARQLVATLREREATLKEDREMMETMGTGVLPKKMRQRWCERVYGVQ